MPSTSSNIRGLIEESPWISEIVKIVGTRRRWKYISELEDSLYIHRFLEVLEDFANLIGIASRGYSVKWFRIFNFFSKFICSSLIVKMKHLGVKTMLMVRYWDHQFLISPAFSGSEENYTHVCFCSVWPRCLLQLA